VTALTEHQARTESGAALYSQYYLLPDILNKIKTSITAYDFHAYECNSAVTGYAITAEG
jgi:hypothetical protein